MRVRIISRYVDKNTGFLMEEGMTANYEPERAKELEKGGFVKLMPDKKTKKKTP